MCYLAIGSICELIPESRSSVARRPRFTKGVLEKHTPSGQRRDVVTPVTRGVGHEGAWVSSLGRRRSPGPGKVGRYPQCRALVTAGGQNRHWKRGGHPSATRISVTRPDPAAPRIRGDRRSMMCMRRHAGVAVPYSLRYRKTMVANIGLMTLWVPMHRGRDVTGTGRNPTSVRIDASRTPLPRGLTSDDAARSAKLEARNA